jgi:hypothetical protein
MLATKVGEAGYDPWVRYGDADAVAQNWTIRTTNGRQAKMKVSGADWQGCMMDQRRKMQFARTPLKLINPLSSVILLTHLV